MELHITDSVAKLGGPVTHSILGRAIVIHEGNFFNTFFSGYLRIRLFFMHRSIEKYGLKIYNFNDFGSGSRLQP